MCGDMNYQEAKERLRKRIALDQADLAAIELAEAALARLESEDTKSFVGSIFVNGHGTVAKPVSNDSVPMPVSSPDPEDDTSLTEIVTSVIAQMPEEAVFSKNSLAQKITAGYPAQAGRLKSISSVIWNMANRGQLYTVRRGRGKQPSLYRRTRESDKTSGVEIFNDSATDSGGAPA